MRSFLIVSLLGLACWPAFAEDGKDFAAFIGDGIYSPSPGCQTLEDIEAGKKEPDISNYPLTLSNEGSRTWEGGCDPISGAETKPGQFDAKMKCSEGDQESEESTTFTRIDETHIELKTGKDALVYEKCTALKSRDADD